ncbi:MAG TPA: hypothetical protein DCF63_11250 [Planctomycetaceae bacterium]|nr:hypothetical protein [Planctomycetaceae bacterium]
MSSSSSRIKESISQAIDSGVPMPEWVESQLASDSQLRQFRQAAEQLSERMRSDASAWVDNCRLNLRRDVSNESSVAFNFSKQLGSERMDFPTRKITAHSYKSLEARTESSTKSWVPRLLALAATILVVVALRSWYPPSSTGVDSQSSLAVTLPQGQDLASEAVAAGSTSTESAAGSQPIGMSDVEKYKVYSIALGTTIDTLRSFNSTMTRSVLGPQLDSLAQQTLQADGAGATDLPRNQSTEQLGDEPVALDARQMQLIREFKQTTHYFVHTFPRQALRLE